MSCQITIKNLNEKNVKCLDMKYTFNATNWNQNDAKTNRN